MELLPGSLEELVLSSVHEQDIQFVLDLVRHKKKMRTRAQASEFGLDENLIPWQVQPGTVFLSQNYPGVDGQNACGV